MMKKLNVLRGLVPILFLVSLAIPGHVFAACYTSGEAEAEQAIRLHSELLVIGLNCRHFSETLHTQGTIANDRQQAGADYQPSQEKGEERDMAPDSYFKYKIFTRKNEAVLREYEEELIAYYLRQGSKDPVAEFNHLRTELANGLARLVVDLRPDIFCYKYAGRLDIANGMSEQDIRLWSATYFPTAPPSQKFCSGQ